MSRKRRFALLGHPVEHSVSPAMHRAAFRALGLPHTYVAMDIVSAREIGLVLDELREGRLDGANVTLPYKRVVLELADEVAASAVDVGAANVLCRTRDGRVVAHNTDAGALAADIEAVRGPGGGSSAVIIGAGGAGLAAIQACKLLGFSLIGVTTRSWVDSESLVQSSSAEDARVLGALASPWPGMHNDSVPTSRSSHVLRMQWCELAVKADLVIQASSAGMSGGDAGDEVAAMVPWDMLPDTAVAYDVVYNPAVTPFLQAASARGLRAAGGLGMLVGQAVRSFELWTGKTPPAAAMREAAEGALAASVRSHSYFADAEDDDDLEEAL